MTRLVPIVLVAALAAAPASAQGSADAALLELSAQEHVLLDELAAIETRLLVAHTELEALHIQERHLQSQLLQLDSDLSQAESDLEHKRSAVRGRARALYMGSERGFLQLLFSAEDLGELIQGSRYLLHILARDEQLLADLHDQRDDVDTLRVDRQEEYDRLQTRIGGRQTTQAEQRALRQRRTNLLSGVRSDRRVVALAAAATQRGEGAIVEATSAATPATPVAPVDDGAAELADEDFVEDPVEDPVEDVVETVSLGFGAQKGQLILPAVGDIIATFGLYDVGGDDEQAFRRGIDIAAEQDAQVRAVYAGQVRRAELLSGFGRTVILDHGDGYFTIYAHLATIGVGVGEMVTASQPIGTVGDTGSLSGVKLHFEVRQQTEPVDPLVWIKLPPGIQVSN